MVEYWLGGFDDADGSKLGSRSCGEVLNGLADCFGG
jgi:hypothetical protein